jgi:hypothetical protein
MAALWIGTSRRAAARQHEAADVLGQMAREADSWRQAMPAGSPDWRVEPACGCGVGQISP